VKGKYSTGDISSASSKVMLGLPLVLDSCLARQETPYFCKTFQSALIKEDNQNLASAGIIQLIS
jgi:hypothetical protein